MTEKTAVLSSCLSPEGYIRMEARMEEDGYDLSGGWPSVWPEYWDEAEDEEV